MNIAVINLKDITKYIIKILLAVIIIYTATGYISSPGDKFKNIIWNNTDNKFLTFFIKESIPTFKTIEDDKEKRVDAMHLINLELAMLKPQKMDEKKFEEVTVNIEETNNVEETTSPNIEIPKIAQIENVSERNFEAGYNITYGSTRIDNESDYTLTQEMMIPDIEISNKKDIIIYHTHTSESYTPCDTYSYTMTGNYRTTDSNYNVIRVGKELNTYLTKKGFNVVHDGTYHDYPAYSGSYTRALDTAKKLLEGTSAEIVIDLHRDAVGNGDTYGPTVMINGERAAQLMFVIGTDGGGLNHPNWIQNLKIAIKVQEKANEMYPGLFRPMIVRNSRYNQHVAKGACIIEVGATANKLGECLLSMQCLANVLDEVCK